MIRCIRSHSHVSRWIFLFVQSPTTQMLLSQAVPSWTDLGFHFFSPIQALLRDRFCYLLFVLTISKKNVCLSDSATPLDFSAIIS